MRFRLERSVAVFRCGSEILYRGFRLKRALIQAIHSPSFQRPLRRPSLSRASDNPYSDEIQISTANDKTRIAPHPVQARAPQSAHKNAPLSLRPPGEYPPVAAVRYCARPRANARRSVKRISAHSPLRGPA